ncbi:MAG: YitT family protein [Schwartzia sp.]|nr:YitT family protein [Schwartzia sp. (in: firmicutes)]
MDTTETQPAVEAPKPIQQTATLEPAVPCIQKKVLRGRKRVLMYLRKYLTILVGALIAAIGLEEFLIPNHVIDGGVVGLSIMASEVTDWPLGVFLVLFNAPFLFWGYKQIGKSFAIATTAAIICLSMWSAIFEPIPNVTEDVFLASIFGGIIDGIGVGLIMRAGGSLDGTEIVAIILDKRTVFTVGEIVMFMNLFILSGAGFLFGWDKAMYSLIAYFIISKMIDVVLKGLDESYAVMIVTTEHEAVSEALLHRLGRGVTMLHGAGGYSGEDREILYSVVTRLEVGKLKEVVLEEDPNAFVTINAVNDIIGGRVRKKAIH